MAFLPLLVMFFVASFSIDLTGLLGYAEDIFNGLMPAFLPIIGISLGIALLLLIVTTISKAVSKKAG